MCETPSTQAEAEQPPETVMIAKDRRNSLLILASDVILCAMFAWICYCQLTRHVILLPVSVLKTGTAIIVQNLLVCIVLGVGIYKKNRDSTAIFTLLVAACLLFGIYKFTLYMAVGMSGLLILAIIGGWGIFSYYRYTHRAVSQLDKAQTAINKGVWGGLIYITWDSVWQAFYSGDPVIFLLDVIVTVLFIFGTYKRSRICAILLFLFTVARLMISLNGYFIETVAQFSVFGVLLAQGVYGTFRFHVLNKQMPDASAVSHAPTGDNH